MSIRDLDRSIERHAVSVLRLTRTNIPLFTALTGATFGALMVGLLALPQRFEGTALVLAGRNRVEEPGPMGQNNRAAETNASLARIAESDEVVRAAMRDYGVERLSIGDPEPHASIFGRLRETVLRLPSGVDAALGRVDGSLTRVKAQLAVRSEPSSDVLRISYRDDDPVVAAEFANALTKAFLERYLDLYTLQGTPEFFSRQKERFDDEFKAASAKLEAFSKSSQIYASAEQRKLLLQRRNDLFRLIATSRGLMAQKRGELQALTGQLRKLAPVTASPYLTGLVDDLDKESRAAAPKAGTPGAKATPPAVPAPTRSPADIQGTPPLLMIKVYQDSMVSLFKVNAELLGAEDLEKQQIVEANGLTAELNKLTNNEWEYLALKRQIDQAATNSDLYARRMIEEQTSAAAYAAKISPLKILQSASVATRPYFPSYWLGTGAAAGLSLLIGYLLLLLIKRNELGADRGTQPSGYPLAGAR